MNDPLLGVFVWYLLMSMPVYWFFGRELDRSRTLTKRVSRVLNETGIPFWVIVIGMSSGWPFVLWRLVIGFPEDKEIDQ